MGKHAKHSPSSLDHLAKCVRFDHMEMDGSGAEGTDLHNVCATGDIKLLEDGEQLRVVTACLDYVDSVLATEGGPDAWHVMREVRVILKDLTYGHADKVLVHKTKPIVHAMDYKFTRVEGTHDFQIKTYGAGLVEMMLEAIDAGKPLVLKSHEFDEEHVIENVIKPEEIITHVICPRLHKIDRAEHNPVELLDNVRHDIEMLYARIDDPFTPPQSHPESCARCANAHRCPAMTQTAVTVGKKLGLPIPTNFAINAEATMEDRATAQVIVKALRQWCDAVNGFNLDYAKLDPENNIPEGFIMINRSTGIRIDKANTAAAAQLLVESGDYMLEDILAACTLSLKEVSENRARNTKGLTIADSKEAAAQTLAGLVKEGSTSFLQLSRKKKPTKQLKA